MSRRIERNHCTAGFHKLLEPIIPASFSTPPSKMGTLRTLIFARHLFPRVHIFAAYIFAPEALGINFRYVSIFAWWLFSFFSPENPLEVIFAPVYAHKYSQKFDMLACIHTKWASLFSRVVIFAGGNFRIFSRRENYNSAKINVLKEPITRWKNCGLKDF